MADRKISDLTALTTPASGDYLPIVDISEAAAASKNKRITIEELMRGVPDGTAAAPGIAFETDPNTGIYSPGADQLAVATNGTGRLFVDATGQVGIGVAAPSHLLQLNGPTATTLGLAIRPTGWNLSHRFSVPTSGDELVISSNYNGSTVDDATAGTSSSTFSTGLIKFATGAVNAAPTERLRITSAGLVGIGTSAPSVRLQVQNSIAGGSDGTIATLHNVSDTGGDTRYSGLNFVIGSDNGTSAIRAARTLSAVDYRTELSFWTNPTGATQTPVRAMTIDYLQRVGIGITAPQANLEVSASEPSITVSATAPGASGVAGSGWFRMRDRTNSFDVAAIRGLSYTSASTGALLFYSAAGGDLNERARLTTEGYFDFNAPTGQPGVIFKINSSEKARLDSSGRLLVGTSTARANFFNTSGISPAVQIEGTDGNISRFLSVVFNSNDTNGPYYILGKTRSTTTGGNTVVASGDNLGTFSFQGSDGTELVQAAEISCAVDGTPGANDMPGRLVFSTTADGAASPTERMRISANGIVSIGTTGSTLGATDGVIFGALESAFTVSTAGNVPLRIYNKDTAGTRYCMEFRSASAAVGSITHDGTNTSYTTSSDYRLKENVAAVTDGITRLQQLKPSRFNFISNPDKTVDGFIAHEAQAVVPECVTGEKDAIDDDGEPVYQGIDQAKLVPLLTAALQEAIAKIETLEARLTAAGIE